jgi:glycosyltransferase involved in cell wall biosynthesis
VERSGAGLLYDRARGDFGAAAASLVGDEALRKILGERGRAYVEGRYRWPRITSQYLDFLAQVFGGSPE